MTTTSFTKSHIKYLKEALLTMTQGQYVTKLTQLKPIIIKLNVRCDTKSSLYHNKIMSKLIKF